MMDMLPRKNKSYTHNFFCFIFRLIGMAVGEYLLQAITHPGDELWTRSDIVLQATGKGPLSMLNYLLTLQSLLHG